MTLDVKVYVPFGNIRAIIGVIKGMLTVAATVIKSPGPPPALAEPLLVGGAEPLPAVQVQEPPFALDS